MAELRQSVVSTQPIQVQVMPPQGYDPTTDIVQMAFIPHAPYPVAPDSGDWNTASWETDLGPVYWATCLVGPANGGVPLAAGTYQTWVKVTDNPAVPVIQGALLTIY